MKKENDDGEGGEGCKGSGLKRLGQVGLGWVMARGGLWVSA